MFDYQAAINRVLDRLTELNAIRDDAVVQGRQAIRHAANCVRALHRSEFEAAEQSLNEASALIDRLRVSTAPFPQIYHAGYVQDAMKEYAEAAITTAILRDLPLPDAESLGIEIPAWLNAMAEAGSELRRDVLDLLRKGDVQRANHLLELMEEIYGGLVTVDFPDAVTGGLRRTVDQFRAVLERTRGDLTLSVQQRELKDAIDQLQSRISPAANPE